MIGTLQDIIRGNVVYRSVIWFSDELSISYITNILVTVPNPPGTVGVRLKVIVFAVAVIDDETFGAPFVDVTSFVPSFVAGTVGVPVVLFETNCEPAQFITPLLGVEDTINTDHITLPEPVPGLGIVIVKMALTVPVVVAIVLRPWMILRS